MSDILDQRTVNPDSVSPRPTAMRYGLLGGLAMIVLNLVFYLSEMLDLSKVLSPVNLIIFVFMVALVILALRYHRDQELGGYLPFTRCLGMGWWLGLTMGVVGAVWTYIFFQFTAPELVETINEVQIEKLYEQGYERGLTEEQIEQSEKYVTMFTNPTAMAVASIFSNVLMTIIIALFAGLFMKKDPPPNV